ncbi:hypothetical protein AB3X52_17525 [Nocardioides sp. DS6]|uniref:DUF1918 domain-containing protein n=1 Tax=Nocardioides eburneus TaxID=3231482 RepID=A0ABV3T5C1_9ACTN
MEPDWNTLSEGDVVYLEGQAGGPVQFRVGKDAIYPQEYPVVHWDHPYLPLADAQQEVAEAGDDESGLRKKYDAATGTWRY